MDRHWPCVFRYCLHLVACVCTRAFVPFWSMPSKKKKSLNQPLLQPMDAGVNGDGGLTVVRGYGSVPTDDMEEGYQLDPTEIETGLTESEANRRLALFGYNELAEKERNKLLEFLGNFWGPMPCMIWLAIIVEGIEADWPDFIVLFALQLVNGLVSWHEHSKAADAVAELKSSLSPQAMVRRDGEWKKINARLLVPGDVVSLNLGASIPADTQVIGPKEIYCDQAALTGESLPAKIKVGDTAKMGSNVTTGEAEGLVMATGSRTFFGKTAALINEVEEGGNFQKVLYNITAFLMVLSIILTGVIMGYMIINASKDEKNPFLDALSTCVVLLVASIPIAMQVVCTSTMAIGSRRLAEKKAIVTRLAAIEELAGMDMLCSDKTGTLTLGKMIMKDIIVVADNVSEEDILSAAAMAAKWKEPARDAIDGLVLGSIAHLRESLDKNAQIDYVPFDPKTKRTESTIETTDGTVFRVTKGAPQVILGLCPDCDENKRRSVSSQIVDLANRGIRSLGVAKTGSNGEGFEFMGILTFLDPPRHDTKETIERAQDLGIEVKMITGDQIAIAKETCFQLGMGTNIQGTHVIPDQKNSSASSLRFEELIVSADGFAEVYPEHKYMIVKELRALGFRCGMTGDGVNDAPALKRADIGIAVQGATDAARAAADIVLTEPGLSVIIDAITLSRKIFHRMKNYVTYRIACTIQLLFFFFLAILAFSDVDSKKMPVHTGGLPGVDLPPYFKLPVMALVVITILNDGTIITIAYDNVVPGTAPEKWHLRRVYLESALLGGVACVSSLVLLWIALQSNGDMDILKHWLNLPNLSYNQIKCMMYLKISLSDFLTVFAARTQGWFWSRRPGYALLTAFFVATFTSSILAQTWPFDSGAEKDIMEPLEWSHVIFVWIYCLVWFVFQDACKMLLRQFISPLGEDEGTSDVVRKQRERFREARKSLAQEKMDATGMLMSPPTSPVFGAKGAIFGSIDSMESVLQRINDMEDELKDLKNTVVRMSGFKLEGSPSNGPQRRAKTMGAADDLSKRLSDSLASSKGGKSGKKSRPASFLTNDE